jgi:surface polysaccharide O-acyltransferase-like enzyme
MGSGDEFRGTDNAIPSTPAATDGLARFVEIDCLKAAGILTIILIHSLRAPWDPRISSTELLLGIVTRFAVPAFLFSSGFLYATTTRIAGATVLRRLRRVLIPYLICSIAAQIWWHTTGQGHTFEAVVSELLLGSSFGPYYYVFIHFFLVLFAPLFAVLPGTVLFGVTVLFVMSQAWVETSKTVSLPFFWHLRSPLLWWGYFLLGWMIRLHYGAVRRWISARRSVLTALVGFAVVACTWFAHSESRNEWVRAAMWLNIHATIAFIFVSTCGRRSIPAIVGTLSDASFAIYLLHLFFIYTAERLVQPAVNEFDVLVIAGYWSAGLFGSLAVIAVARRLLGSRSRDVIGA